MSTTFVTCDFNLYKIWIIVWPKRCQHDWQPHNAQMAAVCCPVPNRVFEKAACFDYFEPENQQSRHFEKSLGCWYGNWRLTVTLNVVYETFPAEYILPQLHIDFALMAGPTDFMICSWMMQNQGKSTQKVFCGSFYAPGSALTYFYYCKVLTQRNPWWPGFTSYWCSRVLQF